MSYAFDQAFMSYIKKYTGHFMSLTYTLVTEVRMSQPLIS